MLFDVKRETKELTNSLEEIESINNTESSELANSNKYNNYIAAWLSTTGFLKVDVNYFL